MSDCADQQRLIVNAWPAQVASQTESAEGLLATIIGNKSRTAAVRRGCADVKHATRQALQSRARIRRLFCRTHELERIDNLFAVLMLVNLARGTVSEFMLVMCRNRIAEHQRVNDPDCTWLHCLPPPR